MSKAKISWNDNWVVLIDSIFQLNTLKYTHSGVSQPDRIRRLAIDPKQLLNGIKVYKDIENNIISLLDVELSDVEDRTRQVI